MKSFADVKQDNYSSQKFYRLMNTVWTFCLAARVFLMSREKKKKIKRERNIERIYKNVWQYFLSCIAYY